jgi:CHAT domain-containing protein
MRCSSARVAAALLAVTAAGAAAWRYTSFPPFSTRPPIDVAFAALIEAVGPRRPLRARLTGGFAHGPAPPAARATDERRRSPELAIAVARIEQAIRDGADTAADRARLAAAQLVVGDTGTAVALLEDVVGERPKPSHWSDLAAAYLTRGRPDDIAAALDAAEQAIRLQPDLDEALFNRALALEALSLRVEAVDAWTDFLHRDRTSAWAREAHVALENMRESPSGGDFRDCERLLAGSDLAARQACISNFPRETRELIEVDLLSTWGKAHGEGQRQVAAAVLQRAERLARDLEDRTGDVSTLRIVHAARSATGADSTSLAAAHVRYQSAKRAYDRQEYEQAGDELDSVVAPFAHAGSPAAEWARLYLAVITYQRSQLQRCVTLLGQLRHETRHRQYWALLGRIEWMQSIADVSRGRFTDAIRAADLALASYRRLNDAESLASLQALQADNLRRLGAADRSWDHLVPALSWLSTSPRSTRRQMIQHVAALTALQQDRLAAAAYFFDAYVDAARATGNPSAEAEALLQRARLRYASGAPQPATQDLESASSRLSAATDRTQAEAIQARLLLTEGEGLARIQPVRAVSSLTRAIAHFEASGRRMFLPRALLARAEAHGAREDLSLAEHDLVKGVTEFEHLRTRIDSEAQRISYFDEAWRLFDRLIDMAMRRGLTDQAFAHAERGRARGLLDAASASAAAPASTPARIAGHLASRTTAITFAVLDDALLLWVMRAGDVRFERVPVSRKELARLAGLWLRTFDASFPADRQRELARTLGALLLDRVRTDPGDTLVFVLDGPLHGLPLAALVNPHTGRLLIEDHPVVIAPRASLLDGAEARSVTGLSGDEPVVLAIGNPALGRGDRGLPPLPAAAREAQAVAALYGGRSVLLTGANATRENFMRDAPEADVVHFAGHALANSEFPDLSSLLFAGSASEGDLRASDIAGLSLTRVRLVVLSACSTAAGPIRRAEGPLSLARPFLKAGAREVVATLWPIDDAAALPLFETFHRELRANASTAEALRRAQLSAMKRDDSRTPIWSSLVLYSLFPNRPDANRRSDQE